MIKKISILILCLASLVIFTVGCETTRGVAKGTAGVIESSSKVVVATGEGLCSAAEGVGKDTTNIFSFLFAADDWIKRNAW